MEISFIIFILILLGIIFLIFKLIKKIIFAIFASVLLVILVFGGVLGLAYYDFNNLANQNNFDVNLYYKVEETYYTGATIPVKNQELSIEEVEGIVRADIDVESIDEVNDDDFNVVINKEILIQILDEKDYVIPGLEDLNLDNYDTSLTKNEIIIILESEDGTEELVEILFDKNDVSSLERSIGKPIIKAAIISYLDTQNLTLKSALLLFVINENINSPSNTLDLIEGYKNGEIEIYPERFTFKLIKYLPASLIQSFIPGSEE